MLQWESCRVHWLDHGRTLKWVHWRIDSSLWNNLQRFFLMSIAKLEREICCWKDGVFDLPRLVHMDQVLLSGWEVFPRRMMPSYCKIEWDWESDNFPRNEIHGWWNHIPSHDHVDDKFHCCSITNITQIESWLGSYNMQTSSLFTEERITGSKAQARKRVPFPWCLRKEQLFRIVACHLKLLSAR